MVNYKRNLTVYHVEVTVFFIFPGLKLLFIGNELILKLFWQSV